MRKRIRKTSPRLARKRGRFPPLRPRPWGGPGSGRASIMRTPRHMSACLASAGHLPGALRSASALMPASRASIPGWMQRGHGRCSNEVGKARPIQAYVARHLELRQPIQADSLAMRAGRPHLICDNPPRLRAISDQTPAEPHHCDAPPVARIAPTIVATGRAVRPPSGRWNPVCRDKGADEWMPANCQAPPRTYITHY